MKRSGPPTVTIADQTRLYIEDHASVREGLREDLLNFTALARKIQGDTGLRNEEAVTIACRRYQRNLAQEANELGKVREVVGRSRLEVHPRVAIVRIRDDLDTIDRLLAIGRRTLTTPAKRRVFQLFLGTRAITVLCEESLLAAILPEVPAPLLLGVERGLGTLAFRSAPEVADIPGVLSFIADALYRSGINCLETISVYTDSIFVFRDSDLLTAYQALSELVPAGQAEPGPDKSRGEQLRGQRTPGGHHPDGQRPHWTFSRSPTSWRAQWFSERVLPGRRTPPIAFEPSVHHGDLGRLVEPRWAAGQQGPSESSKGSRRSSSRRSRPRSTPTSPSSRSRRAMRCAPSRRSSSEASRSSTWAPITGSRAELYAATYGRPHADAEHLAEAVYGLPGVLPTKRALRPARRQPRALPHRLAPRPRAAPAAGEIAGPVIVDAKSGTSGAGHWPHGRDPPPRGRPHGPARTAARAPPPTRDARALERPQARSRPSSSCPTSFPWCAASSARSTRPVPLGEAREGMAEALRSPMRRARSCTSGPAAAAGGHRDTNHCYLSVSGRGGHPWCSARSTTSARAAPRRRSRTRT